MGNVLISLIKSARVGRRKTPVNISLAFAHDSVSLVAWTPMEPDADINCADVLSEMLHAISCSLMETICAERVEESTLVTEDDPTVDEEIG